MKKKHRFGIVGGIFGLVLGLFGGAYLGIVIGGTFFGWVEFSNYPALTGYELGAYLGALLGVLILTPLGTYVAMKIS